MESRHFYYSKLYSYYLNLYRDNIIKGKEDEIEARLNEMEKADTYQLRELYIQMLHSKENGRPFDMERDGVSLDEFLEEDYDY